MTPSILHFRLASPSLRIGRTTLRGVLVALLVCAAGAVRAEEPRSETSPAPDPLRDARTVERPDLGLDERVPAAERLIALPSLPHDVAAAALKASGALWGAAPEPALRLLRRALDARHHDAAQREVAAERIAQTVVPPGEAGRSEGARKAAALFLLGRRPGGVAAALLPGGSPEPVVEEVLLRDLGAPAAGETWASRIEGSLETLRRLDTAVETDPEVARPAFEALLAAGATSLPVLLHEAASGADGVPEGRLPRATRAVTALGLLGDRRATPVLVRALLESPSGWVRVAAATALGDLGDPAAAIALCRQLTYRGDVFRPRQQWDWPGAQETNVPQEEWASVEYYVVDEAAADSLLRIGAAGAAGWLIRNQLDPTRASFRVRVLQDAVDALRRSTPTAPWQAYNPDAGLPQRLAAHGQLLDWWETRRSGVQLTRASFPADDPGFRAAAKVLVESLHSKIMEIQIANETCALLGPAMTPALLEALQGTTSRLHRTEIARALGLVEDPRAVEPLLGLLHDSTTSVRSTAAESLATYVDGNAEVEEALVRLLDDPDAGARTAAMKTLGSATTSPRVLAAIRAHPATLHEERAGASDREYRMAETVALLVHEGEAHWPAVREGMRDAERYVRRQWWDLYRRAARLVRSVGYDPNPEPGARGTAIDDERMLAPLRLRRGT
jgi:HEAT repeat protein